ncbi:BTAD domain-containing putative transcriptional regulator [Eggerthellaceae bacterium 3-80]|nr:hypothetical protein D7W09_02460 [bacterium D16-34]
MSEYVARCALKGARPKITSANQFVSRPHLVAHLMRERNVLRVISAPFGFGKRNLACEYAQTVWQFQHVFWMDATSPCFLRDLDADLIARSLVQLDDQPFLLVILNLPHLDSERVERLLSTIHVLLSKACEVIVTCTPAHDVFSEERTRLTLDAHDLLLTDAELSYIDVPASFSHMDAYNLNARNEKPTQDSRFRIAYFAWDKGDEREFLKRLFKEDMPAVYRSALFAALVLRSAEIGAILACCHISPEEIEILDQSYALFSCNEQENAFVALNFSVQYLCEVFCPKKSSIATTLRCSNRESLIKHLSDVLLMQHQEWRACELVQNALSSSDRAVWLAKHAQTLHDRMCLYPACQLYASLGRERANLNAQLDIAQALRLIYLAQHESAKRLMGRLSKATCAQNDVRILALLVLSQLEGRDRQQKILSNAAELLSSATSVKRDLRNQLAFLICFRKEMSANLERSCELLYVYGEKSCHHNAYVSAATWLFDAVYEQGLSSGHQMLHRVVHQVYTYVAQIENEALTYSQSVCILALSRLVDKGLVTLPAYFEEQVGQAQFMNVVSLQQRRELENFLHQKIAKVHKPAVATPDKSVARTLSQAAPEKSTYPMLTVNLLGGLEVFIGDKRVEPDRFRRQKLKTLLALLVLNKGKEYSRDKLVEIIWPGTSLVAGRKGLYSLWSQLRSALLTPDGECPYLIRQQQSLRLDAALLKTDVMNMELVCQSLFFEQPTYEGWPELLRRVNQEFSEDILPSDNENAKIESWRNDYRSNLVDALVNASSRLLGASRAQESLWFARAALQRDRTREDAYEALVRAQLAVGQRSAAMETCLLCRRYLTDEQGMDASAELMRLYHSIIESEEMLV